RRSRARPPLPRLPPAPRRPPGAAPCRPPPGRGGPDAVRAGHARRALRAGAAPPRPRPATARHAPHHRGRRSLLPRPAPRGTHRRRRLGGDRRRRGALAARAGRVAGGPAAAPPPPPPPRRDYTRGPDHTRGPDYTRDAGRMRPAWYARSHATVAASPSATRRSISRVSGS